MSRRSAIVVAALVVVVLVVIAAAVFTVTRLGASSPTVALGPPRYVEEAQAAGIDHVYDGDFRFATGGGVAAFDCDDDGLPELYVAGGERPASLYRNASPAGGALRFERSDDPVTALTDVTGAYPVDVDGDALTDLVVLRAGDNVILRGTGDCRFERSEVAGLPTHAMTTAFSATWEPSATMPTMAFGSYLTLDAAGQPTSECGPNVLLRPDPGGDGYAPPVSLSPGYCALSMLFSDWDRSGRRDLRVSNDREFYDPVGGGEQLWRVAAGEAPRLYTDADGWDQLQVEGMGIGSRDLTGDGYPEVYLTSQGPNRLQSLAAGPAQPAYRDIGLERGVYAESPYTGGDPLPSTAWHPEFRDVNNDGYVDLFVSKGNVDEQPDYAMRDPSNLLIGRPDGTFVEGAEQAGTLSFARGRGAALADLNLDGLLDLVEVNYRDRVMVWRNVGSGTAEQPAPMGHWLALELTESGPNRDAIGAWVEVRVGDLVQRHEVTVGGGHVGGQLGWIQFGLGPATSAEVRVLWPDGEQGPWLPVTADRRVVVERGATEVRPWSAGTTP
jgi:enediyne biosynthesis protein E4